MFQKRSNEPRLPSRCRKGGPFSMKQRSRSATQPMKVHSVSYRRSQQTDPEDYLVQTEYIPVLLTEQRIPSRRGNQTISISRWPAPTKKQSWGPFHCYPVFPRAKANRGSSGNPHSGVMFHTGAGQHLDIDKLVLRFVRPVAKSLDIDWYGLHGFRRGIASNLMKSARTKKSSNASCVMQSRMSRRIAILRRSTRRWSRR